MHRKVDLQDVEVMEEQQEAFKELCNKYRDIFLVDSGDIGEMPVLRWRLTQVIVHQSPQNLICYL